MSLLRLHRQAAKRQPDSGSAQCSRLHVGLRVLSEDRSGLALRHARPFVRDAELHLIFLKRRNARHDTEQGGLNLMAFPSRFTRTRSVSAASAITSLPPVWHSV